MTDFFEWLSHNAPDWVYVLTAVALGATMTALLLLTFLATINGYWFVAIFIWIVIPSVIVVAEYRKDKIHD